MCIGQVDAAELEESTEPRGAEPVLQHGKHLSAGIGINPKPHAEENVLILINNHRYKNNGGKKNEKVQ